jgi:hypothetical protein
MIVAVIAVGAIVALPLLGGTTCSMRPLPFLVYGILSSLVILLGACLWRYRY